MFDRKVNIPAVVLGVELNGVGVVRSLARAGIPVIAVDTDLAKPGMRTKYGRKYQVQALHGEALIRDLLELVRSMPESPVLFLTQEATVQTVSAYRDELTPWFRLTLGARAAIDLLTNKETFQRFAQQHGFCVPKSLNVVNADTLAMTQALRFPVIVKPARRDPAYSRHFKKAYRIEDFSELLQLCGKILPIFADLIVQEWVEGRDSDIYFCLQYIDVHGQPVASFTGRKIRSWPPHTGGTASCTTASPAVSRTLTSETTRFFEVAGFRGMGSMEYKQDAVTGNYYLIEPTVGRTDYQEEVATLNGNNIPAAAWASAVGVALGARQAAHRPLVWRNSAIDRRSAKLQHQHCGRGELDAGKKTDGWWRWYDPVPTLTLFWQRVGPAVRKRIKRIGITRGVAR